MRFSRSLSVALVTLFMPLTVLHCTNNVSPSGGSAGGAADAGVLNLAGYYVSPLPLQPASAWTQNPGTVNPVCQSAPNPAETGWSDLSNNGGIELATQSSTGSCCTCTARSRSFLTATMPFAGTRLVGLVLFSRGPSDQYSSASFRVSFKLQGQDVGSKILQGESRDNNCAGSSELPPEIVNGAFDLDMSSYAKNGATSFDEIDVDINGYGCIDGTTDEKLLFLGVATKATDGGANPAATTSPTATGTSNTPPAGPDTAGFFPVLCGPSTHLDAIESGACPNGVDLTANPTVTCMIDPCTSANNCVTAQGKVKVNGNRAQADCSALASQCPMNHEMTITTRIKCL